MANTWIKVISILAGNLNLGISYLITTVDYEKFLIKLFDHELQSGLSQGYRDRYDIIDHGHKKNTFMYIFHRSVFTEIREFTTIVLVKGLVNPF